jgi:hypothetical protein
MKIFQITFGDRVTVFDGTTPNRMEDALDDLRMLLSGEHGLGSSKITIDVLDMDPGSFELHPAFEGY